MLKDATKRLLANTLREMLRNTPLSKIRVTEICRNADVQTQVFYYHFRDKYDLAAWIYAEDFQNASKAAKNAIDHTIDGSDTTIAINTKIYEMLWANRDLYNRLFSEKNQNSIFEYMHEHNMDINLNLLREYTGSSDVDKLTLLSIIHYSRGSIGTLIEWLRGAVEATPIQMAEYGYSMLPEALRPAYQKASSLYPSTLSASKAHRPL